MRSRAIIFVILVMTGYPASAGGFLADAMRTVGYSGSAKQLDESNHALGKSIELQNNSRVVGDSNNLTVQSKSCVTSRGSCELGSSLKGTACFCNFGPDVVYGSSQ
jgi:hypothetical protein